MLTASIPPLRVSEYRLEQDGLFLKRRKLVQSTWRSLEFGLDVGAIGMFFDKLFEEFPDLRDTFPENMQRLSRKLFDALRMAVRFLDDPEKLTPVLKDLGQRHTRMGVGRAHYEAFTECFLLTLNSYISAQLPPSALASSSWTTYALEVDDAWQWALGYIGDTMATAGEEYERMQRLKNSQI